MNEHISQQELQEKCDFDRCHCVPGQETAVVDGKSVYCCEGCHTGTGCKHEECNCAGLS